MSDLTRIQKDALRVLLEAGPERPVRGGYNSPINSYTASSLVSRGLATQDETGPKGDRRGSYYRITTAGARMAADIAWRERTR